MNILVFDIETIPNTDLGRSLYNLHDLDDDDVAKVMFFKQRQEKQNEFLPLYLHKVVAISILLKKSDDSGDEIEVISLGTDAFDEKGMVKQFFDGIKYYKANLISWNGKGFDLPVLFLRAIEHQIQAKYFWQGDQSREFGFNNYSNRYHERHLDVMDILSGYQPSLRTSLDHFSGLIGMPGKLGIDGSKVWTTFLNGAYDEIRNYCDTDVINTYISYLRFQHFRGHISDDQLTQEIKQLKDYLGRSSKDHLNNFLDVWNSHNNNA